MLELEFENEFKVDELDVKNNNCCTSLEFFCSTKNKILELEFENEFKVDKLDVKITIVVVKNHWFSK